MASLYGIGLYGRGYYSAIDGIPVEASGSFVVAATFGGYVGAIRAVEGGFLSSVSFEGYARAIRAVEASGMMNIEAEFSGDAADVKFWNNTTVPGTIWNASVSGEAQWQTQ